MTEFRLPNGNEMRKREEEIDAAAGSGKKKKSRQMNDAMRNLPL